LAGLLACLLCAGCAEKEPVAREPAPLNAGQTEPDKPVTALPEHPDWSGTYTDKQGTAEVYSELELRLQEDGTYEVEMSVYRETALEGTAAWEGDALRFTSEDPHVQADIAVADGAAEVTITADAASILTGNVYRFPDGAPEPAAPLTPHPGSAEPVLPGEEPAPEDGREAMLAAYEVLLRDLYENHVLPGGEELMSFEGGAPDQFAVFDVDGDGIDELFILHTDAPMAGMVEKVYSFDPVSGEVREQFSDFPAMTFYDNGVVKVEASHNQGRAGDALWPYTLWTYHAGTDSYVDVGVVDAWDKALGETYGDRSFPTDVDQDGDGVVYYIMNYGDYRLDEAYAVDKAHYELWLDTYLGDAEELDIPFQDLTAENLGI